ncbi:MAG: multiheme c-type cytochrome [Acidobacteriota bacterium]
MGRQNDVRTGWGARLAQLSMALLLFEGVSGLAITFAPFHPTIEWSVLLHTLAGVAVLLPVAWYCAVHWNDYRGYAMSHVVFLGYVAVIALLVCSVSGAVVTWQGLFGVRMSAAWRNVHLYSGLATIGATLPHLLIPLVRVWRKKEARAAWKLIGVSLGVTVLGCAVVLGLSMTYSGTNYVNELPEDYVFLYGEDRPFAPSLARTESGGALDPRVLAGSESCGTSGCHSQILEEWKPSAHRYAAMDPAFQKIQSIMATQNGAESTRYCGGCHDPISLFSGTKNIFVENLTGLRGYNEGVSCLSCHAIHETDLQGNANYVMSQPAEYLWQWESGGIKAVLSDFLIRTYPDEHGKLSKRMYKAPEYCAACHKQFIDAEVNKVGWVQLQNQYDNWAASHWNQEGDPERTVECRECHMPLVESRDPAAGDAADYNRDPDDGMHRSHRFIAANNMMPQLLQLEGWEEQVRLTEMWLQGRYEIPEIRDKWPAGPIISIELEVPETVAPGESIPLRVVLSSNKVGHDFPTGPLDIIQSWVKIVVTDDQGRVIYTSGRRDERNYLEPGTFLFKVEPVDQYGNLIDRHNLWEMVGVRFRRALFPGFTDTVEFDIGCPANIPRPPDGVPQEPDRSVSGHTIPPASVASSYTIEASLNYRKFDQFLLDYMFGEDAGLTAPPVEISSATATVRVAERAIDAKSRTGG